MADIGGAAYAAPMSDYTHISFDEVTDMAPQFGMGDSIEARFAREALQSETQGMTLFRFQPGFRVPFGHRHHEQEELYVIAEGSARMRIDDEILDLKRWDAVRIAPHPTRAVEAGPDGAVMLVFGAGPTGDGEVVQDWWTD